MPCRNFEKVIDEESRRREVIGAWLIAAAVSALLLGAAVGVVIWRR